MDLLFPHVLPTLAPDQSGKLQASACVHQLGHRESWSPVTNTEMVSAGWALGELKAEEQDASRNPSHSRSSSCEWMQTAFLPEAQPGLVCVPRMIGNQPPVNWQVWLGWEWSVRKQLTVHVFFSFHQAYSLPSQGCCSSFTENWGVSKTSSFKHLAQMYKPSHDVLLVAKEGGDLHMLLTSLCSGLKKIA